MLKISLIINYRESARYYDWFKGEYEEQKYIQSVKVMPK